MNPRAALVRSRFGVTSACAALSFCFVCIGQIEGQIKPSDTCNDVVTSVGPSVAANPDPLPRHVLGIFPNHNTSPCLSPYMPLGAKEKFKIASEDAFDP